MNCEKCNLGFLAKRVVRNRGTRKAKILIILDNPSDVDETFGILMAGQEGKLLNQLFNEAFQILNIIPISYYITSIVRCRPMDEKRGPTREARADEILACTDRLMSSINRLKPSYIFLIGKITEKFYKKEFPDAYTLQPIRFLERQGGRTSPWYQTNLRIILEALK